MKDRGKKVVDARQDSNGNIKQVKIQGNTNFTSSEIALKMAKQGKIDLVVVKPAQGKEHLRTRPDSKIKNNLDEMAKD